MRPRLPIRPDHRWRPILVGALLGMLVAPVVATPSPGVEAGQVVGPWLSEQKEVVVEFYRCDEGLCGRIAWLAKPYRKSGELKRDEENPDPALRDRHWCGIQVIRGLEPEGDGVWDDGKVYDPKSGNTYDLQIRLEDEEKLTLRAYLGIKLIGRSETWTRVGPDHELGCIDTGRGAASAPTQRHSRR